MKNYSRRITVCNDLVRTKNVQHLQHASQSSRNPKKKKRKIYTYILLTTVNFELNATTPISKISLQHDVKISLQNIGIIDHEYENDQNLQK